MLNIKYKDKKQSTRDGFGRAMSELSDDPDIVVVTAELGTSIKLDQFSDASRYIEVGIAEQNMATISAGIALTGKKVIMGSFASFNPMRNFDQIRISIVQQNANVKIIGGHSGFSYGGDGQSVQSLEDIALMRSLPNMKVYVPSCAEEAYSMAIQMVGEYGPSYLRIGRDLLPNWNLTEEDFQLGKAQILREGSSCTLIACGYMVSESIEAAEELSKEQEIECSVLNVSTIKPLDSKTILQYAKSTNGIVVAEEHQLNGGLGDAVANLITREYPTKIKYVGVDNKYGQSSRDEKTLRSFYGLDKEAIKKEVIELLSEE